MKFINNNNLEKQIMLLLFVCVTLATSGQVLNASYKVSSLENLSLDYSWNIKKKSTISAGLRIQINTNPEKFIFGIYDRDFHSYTLVQKIGLGAGYKYALYQNDNFTIGPAVNVDYFNLGLKGYKASPASPDPITGRPRLYYDYVSIENGHHVFAVDFNIFLKVKLFEKLRLDLFGGVGVLFNEDFSDENFVFLFSPSDYLGSFIYSFTNNIGVGLSYDL